jgi:heme-degrading monooxygenase HmoA
MRAMVTIGMNYQVLAGKEEVFEAACHRVLEGMAEADGHDTSRIYRDIDAPGGYLIVSRWNDETAFQAFISSDAFKKVTNWGRENILAGRPSHTTYREG